MSACNFSIPFTGAPQDVLNRARSAVETQSGTFDGDTNAGNFSVHVMGNTISGTYTVEGQAMNINIESKPFLLPCGMIETYLKSQLT